MKRLRLSDYVRPGDCCHYARYRLDPQPSAPLHRHDFHEIFWVEAGSGAHMINGNAENLEPGQLILVRPDDAHRYEGPLTFVNVAFATSRWKALLRQYAPGAGRRRGGLSRSARLSPVDHDELDILARDLAAGRRGPLETDRFLMKALAVLNAALPVDPSTAAPPPWVAALLRAIEADPRHFQSTRALAALAGYSPEHLARALRRHTGRTPTEIINTARMAYAARRLTEESSDVLAIALDCGFESLGHFYRLFGRAYGMPPKTYRRRHLAVVGRAGR